MVFKTIRPGESELVAQRIHKYSPGRFEARISRCPKAMELAESSTVGQRLGNGPNDRIGTCQPSVLTRLTGRIRTRKSRPSRRLDWEDRIVHVNVFEIVKLNESEFVGQAVQKRSDWPKLSASPNHGVSVNAFETVTLAKSKRVSHGPKRS